MLLTAFDYNSWGTKNGFLQFNVPLGGRFGQIYIGQHFMRILLCGWNSSIQKHFRNDFGGFRITDVTRLTGKMRRLDQQRQRS